MQLHYSGHRYLQRDKATDELPLVSDQHDIAEERKLLLDTILNGHWSHVLSSCCDDQLYKR